MQLTIGKHFEFEASHQLPDQECYGKCRHLHGHRYQLEVEITGDIDQRGWICDFADLKRMVRGLVIDKFDHQHLNDWFEIPTAENIAIWIFHTLQQALAQSSYRLWRVRLYETSNSYAEVRQ